MYVIFFFFMKKKITSHIHIFTLSPQHKTVEFPMHLYVSEIINYGPITFAHYQRQ
jgi:hypothetical protein